MVPTVGQRLKSQVCETEVIVTRTSEAPVDLLCGGHAMINLSSERHEGLVITEESPTQMGKRYEDEARSLQILVTKPGVGALAANGVALRLAEARALPASD